MHTISKDNKADCPRCETEEGTFMHMFWQILLKHFWNSVHSFTTLVLVFIKGYARFPIRRILITITYFAKKCILLFLEKWVPSYFTAIPGSVITIPATRESDLRKNNCRHFKNSGPHYFLSFQEEFNNELGHFVAWSLYLYIIKYGL